MEWTIVRNCGRAAQRIREMDPEVPILLLTGWGTELDQEKLEKSKVDRVIPKPIHMDEFLNIVNQTLESKRKKTNQPNSRLLPKWTNHPGDP